MGLFDKLRGGAEHKRNRLLQVIESAKPALNLSAEQEQKIKEIFRDFREERRDLKDEGGDNMRDDIGAARKEAKQKLMAVLNDDQKKILEEKLQQWKDQAS